MAPPRAAFVRALVVGALAALSVLALSQPALAAADAPDQIVLSGAVLIPRGAAVGELVVLHGSARVDGVARGDVIVVDGPAVIRGQVSGDVVALDGRVVLGAGSQVHGDVSARGAVVVGEDARVGGRLRQHVAFGWRTPVDALGRFASWLAVSVSTLLLGLLLVLLAPRGLDGSASAARWSPWRAAGWGLALAVGTPVAVVLLAASLVALPLGLVLLLAFGLVAFVGYVVAAYAIGRAIRPAPANRAVAFVVGWAIVRAVGAIPVVSGVTFAVAAVYGVGAASVAAWRARETAGRHRGGRRTAVVSTDAREPVAAAGDAGEAPGPDGRPADPDEPTRPAEPEHAPTDRVQAGPIGEQAGL